MVIREDEDLRSRCSEADTYAKPDIGELEMLLEAYFAQIEGISQQLSTVSLFILCLAAFSDAEGDKRCRYCESK